MMFGSCALHSHSFLYTLCHTRQHTHTFARLNTTRLHPNTPTHTLSLLACLYPNLKQDIFSRREFETVFLLIFRVKVNKQEGEKVTWANSTNLVTFYPNTSMPQYMCVWVHKCVWGGGGWLVGWLVWAQSKKESHDNLFYGPGGIRIQNLSKRQPSS